jgi:succinyl-CoA synthetase beta subunit
VIKDFTLALAPVSVQQAKRMIESVKLYPLLNGFRGGAIFDVEAIAKAISGLSLLMRDFSQIQEIDINPLAVGVKGEGVLALDAKIIFEKEKIPVS